MAPPVTWWDAIICPPSASYSSTYRLGSPPDSPEYHQCIGFRPETEREKAARIEKQRRKMLKDPRFVQDSVQGLVHRALTLQLSAVSHLHREDCQGTEDDVTKMRSLLLRFPELLEYRNDKKEPPLISAVEQAHPLCVKFLLENGADVNALSSHMSLNALSTAFLTIQCEDMKRKIVNMLLEYGSNPDYAVVINSDKKMPLLSFLVIRNQIEYVELFLKSGINPNTLCNVQLGTLTCLQFAVMCDLHELVEVLLSYGADPYMKTHPGYDSGLNLVQNAVKFGKIKTLIALLSNGVGLKVPDDTFESETLDSLVITSVASDNTQSAMVEVLSKFGYRFSEPMDERVRDLDYSDQELALHQHIRTKANNVLSLMDLSRLSILKAGGRGFVHKVDSLELPKSLCDFLKFSDLKDGL